MGRDDRSGRDDSYWDDSASAYGRSDPARRSAYGDPQSERRSAYGDPRSQRDRLVDPIGQRPRTRPNTPAHLTPRHDRRRLVALVVAALVLVGAAVSVQQFVLSGGDSEETLDLAPPSTAAP